MSNLELTFIGIYVIVGLTSPIWGAFIIIYFSQKNQNESDNTKAKE